MVQGTRAESCQTLTTMSMPESSISRHLRYLNGRGAGDVGICDRQAQISSLIHARRSLCAHLYAQLASSSSGEAKGLGSENLCLSPVLESTFGHKHKYVSAGCCYVLLSQGPAPQPVRLMFSSAIPMTLAARLA